MDDRSVVEFGSGMTSKKNWFNYMHIVLGLNARMVGNVLG